jgi:hypothetical protein
MKKSKRILILAVAVEVLLAAIMVGLTLQLKSLATMEPSFNEEAAARIGTAIGAATGALGVFFVLFALHLRKQGDRSFKPGIAKYALP